MNQIPTWSYEKVGLTLSHPDTDFNFQNLDGIELNDLVEKFEREQNQLAYYYIRNTDISVIDKMLSNRLGFNPCIVIGLFGIISEI